MQKTASGCFANIVRDSEVGDQGFTPNKRGFFMEPVTGVFETRSAAEHAFQQVHAAGIPTDKITLLTPGSADQVDQEVENIPTDPTEPPGMGRAIGALLGG